MMKRLHIATLCMVAGCGLPEGDYFGKVEVKDPTHFRFCNSGEPEYVDPALTTSTTGTPLARLMFAGLAETGKDLMGTPVPAIAKSWDVSEDMRTFTFHLRDDVQWSNGRPVTAHDFVYHVTRILHPATLSRNTTPLEPVKNAKLFNAGRVKVLTADAGPFKRGDIVEVVGRNGEVAPKLSELDVPNSNIRRATKPLRLRDLGADVSKAYATVPPGEDVDIIELGGPARDWAYVFWATTNIGRYGWIPKNELDIEPSAKFKYTVRSLRPEHRLGESLSEDLNFNPTTATVEGASLLMLPDALGVRAEGDHTFVVETWSPVPYLINEISGRTFRPSPRESVSRSPLEWTRPHHGLLVTSGPFHMTEWKVRDRLVFEKSDTYYDKHLVKVEKFTAFSIDDQAAATNFYVTGGCDAMASNNIPYSYLPILQGKKRGGKPYKDFILAPYLGIYYFTINTERLDNVHLRRALNHAIDRSAFPEILGGGEVPTSSFMPGQDITTMTPEQRALCGLADDATGVAAMVAEDLCYVPPKGAGFDVAKAKEELALAKKELGSKFPDVIDVKFNTGSEGHKIVSEYLQDQWKRHLGIDIHLSSMEWKTYLKETTTGNFDIARMGWIGDKPDPESQFLIVFRCGSPYNRARWCNDEFEALFKKGQNTTDRVERLAIFRKAEEVLAREAPVIPLYVYTQKLLRKPYVRDLPLNIGDSPPMFHVWLDENWKDTAE